MRTRTYVLLLWLYALPASSVSWTDEGATGVTMSFDDFSNVTWTSDAAGRTYPFETLFLQQIGGGSQMYCGNTKQFSSPQCYIKNPTTTCETQDQAAYALSLWLGRRLTRTLHNPDYTKPYVLTYACGHYQSGRRWIAKWTGSDAPSPASCSASDTTVNISAFAGGSGNGRSTMAVVCTRTSDVTLSIPSENVPLDQGSVKVSLDNAGPRVTLKGVTSTVIDVSAQLTDTTLPAGVHVGSTVVTISPL